MVHTWSIEIKEYDIRAHVYSMLALRKKHGRLVMDMKTGYEH